MYVQGRGYHDTARHDTTNTLLELDSNANHWHLPDGTDLIDKTTHEIHQDQDKTTYTSLDEIAEDLPDHAPRFILLSYPLTMPDGRLSVPYVLLYYLPITTNAETRMLYAGAKELIRNTAEVNKVIDIESAEDLEDIPKQLATEKY